MDISIFCGLCCLFPNDDTILPVAYCDNTNYVLMYPFDHIQDVINNAIARTLQGDNHHQLSFLRVNQTKMRLVCTDHVEDMNLFVYAAHGKYWVLVVSKTLPRKCPCENLKPLTRVFLSGVLISTMGYMEPVISLFTTREINGRMAVYSGCPSFPLPMYF